MTQTILCKIKIPFDRKEETPGEVCVKSFSKKERGVRALKTLGVCWGLAVASVIIPIAHFILVPGFFIAGIFLSSHAYFTEKIILEGKGSCPKCRTPLQIKQSNYKWPLTEICQNCRADLLIAQVEQISKN